MAKTTIYYDGDCPLCRAEIGQYARLDRDGALDLVNVADPASQLPEGTSRADALARFHARTRDGQLVSGARAFVEVWRDLPGWRWLAHIARLPGAIWLMEVGYRLFLPLRPAIVRLFVAVTRRRA
ncbi:thiol-disulfide oxidoreductase DCC family protein [Sinisalibacter lacisalsi]|uniref:Thiol-disulfide oxidoreductase n=1 Tax=Sinisalibacter lacisalsi TaxID=1526570 RepID=A0ABQ1QUL8_9RHOB|nr:DUF393 domain-containing protein [Sinisalibacter lacisalsi]GGD44239.1 thiol-disulfide oxidoreductase [Sinisalibacter lacisalsi]